MAHALAQADGETTIERFGRADRVRDGAQIRERGRHTRTENCAGIGDRVTAVGYANARIHVGATNCGAIEGGINTDVGIDEAGQVNTLGPSEVGVRGVVANELLFVADVHGVNARVGVVLAENGDIDSDRNSSGGRRIVNWTRIRAERRTCGERLLLDAVGGDGADLSQHVLASVIDASIGAKCGLAVTKDVPRKTKARLEHFVLVGNFSVRRKIWIAEIRRVSRLRRGNDWIGEPLRFPAKSIVNGKIARKLPSVLGEKSKLVVDDGGEAGLIERFALCGRTVLKEEEKGSASGGGSSRACGWRHDERSVGALLHRWAIGDVVHEADRTVEDVAACEKASEDLGVLGVQPFAAFRE